MKSRLSTLAIGLSLFLAAQQVFAGDLYLQVFYGAAPVSGATVEIDGEEVGVTNETGALDYTVQPGAHEVVIGSADTELASFDFTLGEDEHIDVVVDAGGAGEPRVSLDTYIEGDPNAGTGLITGTVQDRSGAPLAGAEIEVIGTDVTATTNANGEFELEAPRGTQFVQATSGANSSPQVEIRVLVGAAVDLDLTVRPPMQFADNPTLVMEEATVIASAYNPNPVDTISMEREAMTVVDALDMAQIERFGDSDVASAVRRIVGVTVREGKYAIVRGLEGRYIGTTINGAMVPSTDPLRRDLELDLFPADILQSIEVQKGFTADRLGESTAGAMDITTRGIPDQRIFKISVSGGYGEDVTGENTLNYEGSETDDYGFDDDFRALPANVRAALEANAQGENLDYSNEEMVAIAQSLTNVYAVDYETEKAVPAFGITAVYGDRYMLDEGEWGFYGVASWGMDTERRLDYIYQSGGAEVGTSGTQDRVEKNYDFTGYLAAGVEYDAFEINSKTMFLRQTQDMTTFQTRIDASENDRVFEDSILDWTEREFVSQQLTGRHYIGDAHLLNWSATASQSSRYQPDRRSYQYDNGLLIAGLLERRWSDLTDDATHFDLNYEGNFEWRENLFTQVTIGGMANEIERETEVYRVGFNITDESFIEELAGISELRALDPETIFLGDLLSLENESGDLAIQIDLDGTESTASYDANNEVSAFYLQTETEIGDYWSVTAGVRQEDFTQQILYPNSTLEVPELDSSEALGNVGLTYSPNDLWLFRLNASNTVSYPGITERSESITYDPETNLPIFGNGNLVVSEIDNLDLRAEYYFDDGGSSVSLGAFYKDIMNPIERARAQASGGVRDSITYRNNESAEVRGVELDANITLFDGVDWDGFIGGNIAYTDSELTLDALSEQLEADPNRQLQGLSPYIANIQFGVDHIPSGQGFTIVLNYFDDRIDRVVTSSVRNPIYELGRLDVGLNYEIEFLYGGTLSFEVSNLLDEETRFEGTSAATGDVVFQEAYRKGREFGISYSYEF